MEADEAADHRDRHDVADRGHELDGPAVERPRHALVGDVDDVGFELGHALGDQLGEDGAAVQRVHGRIGGRERLYAGVTEGETAGEAGVVAVEQARMFDEKSSTRPVASATSSNVLTVNTPVPGTSHTGASARSWR